MKKARIVFFGTPEFASTALLALAADARTDVAAVVTAPDKPAGRGLQVKASHVGQTAQDLGIPVLKPEKLRDSGFLADLAQYDADLFVVVAFRMLPEAIWAMPPKGTFNVHASLLPDYRGAAPIQWSIANGDTVTGVTTFLLNDRIDEGEILRQEKLEIGPNEALASLYERLMHAGAALAVETIHGLMEGKWVSQPQIPGPQARLAPKIYPPFGHLELLKTLPSIHHRIRACDPFPGASFHLEEAGKERIKLFQSEMINDCISTDYTHSIELIISDEGMQLTQGEGVLQIHEIQWPGKRKMDTKDFLRGFRLRGKFALKR